MMHARLMNGEVLSQADAAAFMREVMAGEMSGVRMAAALAALRVRGETPGEIAGFAQAMRENAVRVNVRPREVLLDVVGTGGDGAHTFNISTTTAFVVAGRACLSPSMATAPPAAAPAVRTCWKPWG